MAGDFSDDEWSDDDFTAEDSDDEGIDNQRKDDSKQGSAQSAANQDSKPKPSKHLLLLQQRLGLDELKKRKAAEEAEKSAKKLKEDNLGPQVVVYSDPSKRKRERDLKKQQEQQLKKPVKSSAKSDNQRQEAPEFDLIKAKHEVKRLTIQSLKKASKAEAQAALAVSLGALPPKAKAVNYKELKETRKAEQERLKKLKEEENIFASRVQSMTKKKKPKKNKNKVANFDAGFGKFSPGLRKEIAGSSKSKK